MNRNSDPSIRPELRPSIPDWAIMSEDRIDHVKRVAALAYLWALEMGVPDSETHRWLRAVWLHDALRDAPLEDLERSAPTTPGPIEPRHGPASAARAKGHGETDRGVLDAVRYHSVGLAEWDMVGRVLYCADFLDPGRPFDREERAALAREFPTNPTGVLLEVARRRLTHLAQSAWPIPEPTYRFWNSLVSSPVRSLAPLL